MQLASLVEGHVETVDAATPLREAAQWMVSREVGSLVVTHAGHVRGIFTEHDLARATAHHSDMDADTVDDWMSDPAHLARSDWTIEDAADAMVRYGVRHLPIVDDDRLAGMVSIKDLVRAMRGTRMEE